MPRLPYALALSMLIAAPAQASPQAVDAAIARSINGKPTPVADVAADVLSNSALLVLAPVLTSAALAQGNWREPVGVFESQLVAGVLTIGVKALFRRDRPYVTHPDIRPRHGLEDPWSFPSGHASLSFAGASALAASRPAWAAPAYAWAGGVSLSRVYNGMHYPSDVLAGALLGVGASALSSWAFAGLNDRLFGPAAAPTPPAMFRWSTGF